MQIPHLFPCERIFSISAHFAEGSAIALCVTNTHTLTRLSATTNLPTRRSYNAIDTLAREHSPLLRYIYRGNNFIALNCPRSSLEHTHHSKRQMLYRAKSGFKNDAWKLMLRSRSGECIAQRACTSPGKLRQMIYSEHVSPRIAGSCRRWKEYLFSV